MSSSSFSVEREGQRSQDERASQEKNCGRMDETGYDKTKEIGKILEKIARERIREAEEKSLMESPAEEDQMRRSLQESGLHHMDGTSGKRSRHQSGREAGQRNPVHPIFSNEKLLRELRGISSSSSDSSKSEFGRGRDFSSSSYWQDRSSAHHYRQDDKVICGGKAEK